MGHYDPGITTQGDLEAEGRKKTKTELGIPSSLVLKQKKECSNKFSTSQVFSSVVLLSNETLSQRRVIYNLKTS